MQHTSPGTPASPFLFLAACCTIQRKQPSQTQKKKNAQSNIELLIKYRSFPFSCGLFHNFSAQSLT